MYKRQTIYRDLKLDKLDCCVAIIKNARSNKMGKKDIIKVECPVDMMNLDILGFIDHNITVNIISDGKSVEKKPLKLPKQVVNVIRCKNPRCITSIEQELDQIDVYKRQGPDGAAVPVRGRSSRQPEPVLPAIELRRVPEAVEEELHPVLRLFP